MVRVLGTEEQRRTCEGERTRPAMAGTGIDVLDQLWAGRQSGSRHAAAGLDLPQLAPDTPSVARKYSMPPAFSIWGWALASSPGPG